MEAPTGRTSFTLGVAGAASLFTVAVVFLVARVELMDFQVYRAAGQALLDGKPLYDQPVWNELSFVYPPWAAVTFVPFAMLPDLAAKTAVVAGNLALLAFVIARTWMAVNHDSGRPPLAPLKLAIISALTAGMIFWIEAIHTTVYIGQLNLLLVALVLADLLRPDSDRSKGIGVGFAAGLKLTPLIFTVYLVATRRFRAAGVAVGAFLVTVAAGFLVAPADSYSYWLGGVFADTRRIKLDDASAQNQSLRGMLLRTGLDVQAVQPIWLGLSLLILAVVISLAVWASRSDNELLAVTLIGLTGAALSPWSWGHHWVWLAPFAVFLIGVATRRRWRGIDLVWAVPALLLLCTFPKLFVLAVPADQLSKARLSDGPVAFTLGNIYLLIFMTTVAASLIVIFAERRGMICRR